MSTPDTAATDARDIVSTRVFDASADSIFSALSQPDRLARWWGPEGFRNSFAQFDFRQGGDWKFTMHGPDGVDYPNHMVFEEIAPSSRLVLKHVSSPLFVMTMTLSPEGAGRTRLTWRQRFESADIRDRVAGICIPANEQNFDRLQAELARVA